MASPKELAPPLPSTQPTVSLTVLGGGWSSQAFHLIHELSPGSSAGEESASNAGDPGLIPESGRSPGEGNGNPVQYSCLENPMDGGVWPTTVHWVARVRHDLVTRSLTLFQRDEI